MLSSLLISPVSAQPNQVWPATYVAFHQFELNGKAHSVIVHSIGIVESIPHQRGKFRGGGFIHEDGRGYGALGEISFIVLGDMDGRDEFHLRANVGIDLSYRTQEKAYAGYVAAEALVRLIKFRQQEMLLSFIFGPAIGWFRTDVGNDRATGYVTRIGIKMPF